MNRCPHSRRLKRFQFPEHRGSNSNSPNLGIIQKQTPALIPRHLVLAWLLLLVMASGLRGALQSDEIILESVGARGGFSATSIDDGFYQVELFSKFLLPWRIELESGWNVRTGLDGSAGILSRGGEDGLACGAGATLAVGWKDFPLTMVGGSGPTLLSRTHYDDVDFGVSLQFTSHVGFNLDLGSRLALTYRFQHMSNASISRHNPGLDLHSFALGFRF